jgi:hypothetical protein
MGFFEQTLARRDGDGELLEFFQKLRLSFFSDIVLNFRIWSNVSQEIQRSVGKLGELCFPKVLGRIEDILFLQRDPVVLKEFHRSHSVRRLLSIMSSFFQDEVILKFSS